MPPARFLNEELIRAAEWPFAKVTVAIKRDRRINPPLHHVTVVRGNACGMHQQYNIALFVIGDHNGSADGVECSSVGWRIQPHHPH